MMEDADRMLFCDVCGADACFGFGVTLEGIRMGDFGAWRCESHHPDLDLQMICTREEWSEARGKLYPDAMKRVSANQPENIQILCAADTGGEA